MVCSAFCLLCHQKQIWAIDSDGRAALLGSAGHLGHVSEAYLKHRRSAAARRRSAWAAAPAVPHPSAPAAAAAAAAFATAITAAVATTIA